MATLIRSIYLILLTLVWTSPALAEARRAFVVGISQYDNFSAERQLQNAVSDAEAVAKALGDISFDEVVPRFNLKRSEFNGEWQNFLNSIQEGDIVAFYFSGHGVQIGGKNYLLPRNMPYIQYGRSEQIKSESLSVNSLLSDIREREPRVTIIILDACRNDPLIPEEYRKSVTGKGGLAGQIGDPPEGTFIMYAAAAGQTALDRLPKDSSPYSVYTRHLLELLPRQDLGIHEMARKLREQVGKTTENAIGYKQRPAYYDGIDGEFCLPGCAVDKPPVVRETRKAPVNDSDTVIASVTRDPQDGPGDAGMIQLRSEGRIVSISDAKSMVAAHDFVHKSWNPEGAGIKHEYSRTNVGGDEIVIDRATDLTWQAIPSDRFRFSDAVNYVRQLNQTEFAGVSTWRLPTLEEAMSLLTAEDHFMDYDWQPPFEKQLWNLYMDPVFSTYFRLRLWTSDRQSDEVAWVVRPEWGRSDVFEINGPYYARVLAVSSTD